MVSLPLFKTEREMISKSISPKLKELNYNVRVGVRLRTQRSKLKGEESLSDDEINVPHPLSPDIDLLYWPREYQGEPVLNAVEVKYFRMGNEGFIRPPFYDGIGEALILSTYGVDYVHLWHFFDPEIPNEIFENYRNIIENILENVYLINYKCELLKQPVKLKGDREELMKALQYTMNFLEEGRYANSLHLNSLKYNENSKIIRSMIKKAYRIVNR